MNYQKIEFIYNSSQKLIMLCWPAQLNQVFSNILINACQAILIKDFPVEKSGCIKITSTLHLKEIEIKIEDNGCGMNQVTRKKMFDPFFTTKAIGSGTGLGLSVSHGIVQRHGGRFLVESQEGVGTKLSLFLPLSQGYQK